MDILVRNSENVTISRLYDSMMLDYFEIKDIIGDYNPELLDFQQVKDAILCNYPLSTVTVYKYYEGYRSKYKFLNGHLKLYYILRFILEGKYKELTKAEQQKFWEYKLNFDFVYHDLSERKLAKLISFSQI